MGKIRKEQDDKTDEIICISFILHRNIVDFYTISNLFFAQNGALS